MIMKQESFVSVMRSECFSFLPSFKKIKISFLLIDYLLARPLKEQVKVMTLPRILSGVLVHELSQSLLLPYHQLRREGRGGAEAPLSLLLIYPTPSDVG